MQHNTDDHTLIYQQINIDRINAELKRLNAPELVPVNYNGYLAIALSFAIDTDEYSLISEQSIQKIKLLPDLYLQGKITEEMASTFWNAIGEIKPKTL